MSKKATPTGSRPPRKHVSIVTSAGERLKTLEDENEELRGQLEDTKAQLEEYKKVLEDPNLFDSLAGDSTASERAIQKLCDLIWENLGKRLKPSDLTPKQRKAAEIIPAEEILKNIIKRKEELYGHRTSRQFP